MDIDSEHHWDVSDISDNGDTLDSSDSHLIHEAPPRQLLRLRKDELVRLYAAAGLTEDAELFTKHEIVDCIIAARDEVAELPPSSPGVADSNSSDYSSDGGNVAGGEETDFNNRFRNGLRRRATVHDLSHASRRHAPDRRKRFNVDSNAQLNGDLPRRRGLSNASSNRSSPTTSTTTAHMLPSPPLLGFAGKGKGKQVEFNDEVQVNNPPSVARAPDDESDLTDLTEVESSIVSTNPSPRRLRSKGERERVASKSTEKIDEVGKRVTPPRKAKDKVGSLQEEDTDLEEDELEESEADQDEEVDQLAESPSPMATPKAIVDRRTPMRRRLRSRRLQTHTPPSDGDDEGSDEDEEEGTVVGSADGDDESSVVDEEQTLSEPRVLRNGKIVGEEDLMAEEDVEEDIGDEDEDDEDEDEDEEDGDSQGSIADDVDAEGEIEEGGGIDETVDNDVDLSIATAKTLVRLRRDDLVRLCETRELDSGTKPQLAEALLQWRDCHCSEASSPSSAGTARPSSVTTPRANGRRKTRSKSNSRTPPVLLRSEHVHMDEPRTPPVSGRQKEAEPELELDLESLGLDDREIPPEKLTKLEKIGSGGFKDVFVGKFKGRRVAIAEFRGQLSSMDIKELKLLGDFDHPNIVRFLGVSIPENTRETPVMIVSELCSNGDLFDYIRNTNPPSLYKVLSIMLDIARGLEYLHLRKPSVIHRDCKSSNILITSKGIAKITDFGLAKVKQSTRSMVRSLVGTVNWQAPELWHAHPKYNHKVDVFSCAMVFWEILQWHLPNKKFPWRLGMNEHAIYDLVGAKRQRPSVSGLRKHWCPEIVDLIERMWAQDPQDRPTMSEVVEELERLVRQYR
ncbi:Mitogen-activated protein kinase kinase kinase 12 [Grifola frondosa]|uniref:Mitogen-activated protein kinase kinase kinase 12 n=1 Tax=Grifola frondosa TaxID=5627 RepID=A0A1C7LME8_GRIFR|nr:Mitogen-activated protein kinase kinase kinase 12 [Grifola frondosa]